MIKEVTMFAVFCDNCGKQCEDEDAGFCAWSDEVGAKESACECGWLNENDKDYCPDCYSYDEDDNLMLKIIEPMTNSEQAIREFVDKWGMGYFDDGVDYGYKPTSKKIEECLSDLTALISEHYYPKEFVMWKDKKDLRYSSLHNRYYSDTDNGMREFTLDELFNYWEENEQEEEHPTNKEKFDGNYLPDPE